MSSLGSMRPGSPFKSQKPLAARLQLTFETISGLFDYTIEQSSPSADIAIDGIQGRTQTDVSQYSFREGKCRIKAGTSSIKNFPSFTKIHTIFESSRLASKIIALI